QHCVPSGARADPDGRVVLPHGQRARDRARPRSRRSAAPAQGHGDALMLALTNARVLLDEGFADDRAVLVEAGRIVDVVARSDPRINAAKREDLGGAYL